jgi:CheY-like chemotaxis protein/ribosomal protein L32
MYLSI